MVIGNPLTTKEHKGCTKDAQWAQRFIDLE
jgi:hypothetical protein